MKRIIVLVAALLLSVSCVMTAFAASDAQRVYDFAGLFSAEDTIVLEKELAKTSDTIGMDVAVLTSEDKNGASMAEYADDFYDASGLGTGDDRSGLVLFIDMEDRTVYISTTGKAITYYTDERLYDMTDGDDVLYGFLADGDYRSAVERCLSKMVYYYNEGIDPRQYTQKEAIDAVAPKRITPFEVFIAVVVPGLIAFIVVNNIRNEYMMKKEKKQSENFKLAYRSTAAFAYAGMGDELVNRSVTRRIRPVVTSSGGGHSSGGRSTIHMGGSGSFHGGGGGGRHF